MNVIIKYSADTKDFEQGSDNVEQSIKSNTKSANEFSKTLSEGINKIAIGSMSKQFDALDRSIKEVSKDGKITADELAKIKKQANDVGKELGEAVKKGDLKNLAKQAEDTTKQFTSLRAELRFLKQQISSGELEGVALQKATLRASQLTDQLNDLSLELKTLGSDTRVFDTMVEGARLAVGAFSVAQGAVALFGNENEDLQKALIKLNAVMAISNGLQEIAQLRQKETAIGKVFDTASTWAQTTAQTAYNVVVGTSTGLLRIFKIALASTGIGLLVIGLVALIANFDRVKAYLIENIALFKNLGKYIEQIRIVIGGLKEAFIQSFKSIGDVLGKLVTGDFKGAVTAFENLGKDVGNAFVKGEKEAIANKQRELYNDLLNSTIEFRDRQIALLEAQGKDTNSLVERNLVEKIRLLSNSLTDEQKLEYQRVSEALKKLRTNQDLSEQELKVLKGKSDEIKALNEAEDALLIFRAKRQKQLNDEAIKRAEEYAKQLAEKRKKERDDASKIFKDYLDDLDKASKEGMLGGKEAGLTIPLDQITIGGKIPEDEITKVTKEFARDYLNKLKAEFSKEENNAISDAMRKQIDEASRMIDDNNLQMAFKNLFTGLTDIYDALDEKGKDKITGILGGALEMAQGIANVLDAVLARQIANLDKLIDKQRDRVSKASELAEKGNAVLLEAEETKLQKLEELRRKDGEKQKALAIVQATINTALGITNAFATANDIYAAIVLAAITAAAGAVQIGLISSQTFAKGGYTGDGRSNADETGERPVGIVHEKEFVFDRHTTAKNREWFEYIHKNKVNISDMFKANQMANFGGVTINKSVELNELKAEINELKQIMRVLPERMPRANVSIDENGFALSVGHAISQSNIAKNNIHD